MLFAAIITTSYLILSLLIIISIILWILAGIPLKKFKPLFLVIVVLVLIGTMTQAVFYTERPGYIGTRTVLFYLNPYNLPIIGMLPVTVEGIEYGIIFSMRMIVILIPPLFLPFTTHPSEIILMLRKMRFPEWLILLITMSIRFLPITLQNFFIIRNAQKLRKDKIGFQDLLLLLESLIITSLRTAKQMALALEVKAFGCSEKRTSLKTIKFSRKDVIFSLFSVSILLVALFNMGA
jgi:energy-coupling factor transport system permease protein